MVSGPELVALMHVCHVRCTAPARALHPH